MSNEHIVLLVLFICISIVVLASWNRFFGNSPLYSTRAKKLKQYAESIGCAYTAEANTFKERVLKLKPERKFNVIKGTYDGRFLEVYDYSKPSRFVGLYWQKYFYLTFINNTSFRRLSIEQIKSIIEGTASSEMLDTMHWERRI